MSGALLMAASMPRSSGGSGAVTLTSRTVTKVGNGTASVTGTYWLYLSGSVKDQSLTNLETWLHSGVSTDYEARATFQSGDALTSGTLGSWLNLSTSRSWSLTAAAGSDLASSFLVEIRDVATSTVQASANITINVLNTP
jgi:hypothetical protein